MMEAVARGVRVAETYEDLRPLLFSIAYRMLGSVTEAEDIVQDAFLRYQRALSQSVAQIESPKAYLSAVTTRLDYGYGEVAAIVGKSEDNCRQVAVRARRHVEEQKPRFEVSQQQRDELGARFFEAVGDGDMDGLVELLAADVVVVSDGGGRPGSWRRPIFGRENVVRLLLGLGKHVRELGVTVRRTHVNGQPGALFLDSSGRVLYLVELDIADGIVQTVHAIIAPDKLRHLGPLGDIRALRKARRASV